MSIAETRHDQLYPTLTAAQVETARRFASGTPQRFAAGAVMMPIGARAVPAFLVLDGSVEITGRDGLGHESLLVSHGPGQITGEMSQVAGLGSIAEGRAGPDGCEAVPFDAAHLRALLIGSADLGEVLMRAFILRRTSLVHDGGGGLIVLGRRDTAPLVRLQGFLRRNGYPHVVLDSDVDQEAATLVARFGLATDDLPMVLLPDGTLLRRPGEVELAGRLGLSTDLDPDCVHDVAVVGAGPAGLATAVYGASEGLAVIVLDERAFGGQAGASARIENYLGFPTGISGQALAGRAFTQAIKFGAQVGIPLRAVHLDCTRAADAGPLTVVLEDGRRVKARTVVIASGARYRKPAIEGLEAFEGAGVSYWASPVEAKLCAGEEIALIGGGNSAGQAVAYLAPQVKTLHLVVRGDGLEASMSRYLIERIAALPNVVVHRQVEIVAVDGTPEGHLAGATFLNRVSGHERHYPLRHLFLFIGAEPNTSWLDGCGIKVDPKGFVLTGPAAGDGARQPLETSMPGVFAVGDVRSGSTKRVAAGVGEGAAAVAQIHTVLSRVDERVATVAAS